MYYVQRLKCSSITNGQTGKFSAETLIGTSHCTLILYVYDIVQSEGRLYFF